MADYEQDSKNEIAAANSGKAANLSALPNDFGALVNEVFNADEAAEYALAPTALTDARDAVLQVATESVLNARREAIREADKRSNVKPKAKQGSFERKFFKDEKFFKYYEAQGYVNPAEFLMQVVSSDTKILAEKLVCSVLEAFKLKLQAANFLLPYRLAKMPVAINATNENRGLFIAAALEGGKKEDEQLTERIWPSGAWAAPMKAT